MWWFLDYQDNKIPVDYILSKNRRTDVALQQYYENILLALIDKSKLLFVALTNYYKGKKTQIKSFILSGKGCVSAQNLAAEEMIYLKQQLKLNSLLDEVYDTPQSFSKTHLTYAKAKLINYMGTDSCYYLIFSIILMTQSLQLPHGCSIALLLSWSNKGNTKAIHFVLPTINLTSYGANI